MECPDCENIAAISYDMNDVYLCFPIEHSFMKVAHFLDGAEYIYARNGDSMIRLRLTAAQLNRFVTEINGVLSSEEQAGTRVLLTPPGVSPGIDDLRRVSMLDQTVARIQGRWLEGMLSERRYQSQFQPIIDAKTEDTFAVEALFRCRDENGNIIAPSLVFGTASRAGLMFQLDLAARRSAVEGAAGSLGGLTLFINFNPSSIYDPSFCLRTTVSAVSALGLKPEQIVFEVTESEEVRDKQHLRGILAYYRSAGFKVAIDDVGAGHSGLTLLQEIQPDYLKIDMHLIRSIDTDHFKQSIVRHIIALAHENSIRVVAEGIETQAEMQWLQRANVDYLQGYLIAKPSDIDRAACIRQKPNAA